MYEIIKKQFLSSKSLVLPKYHYGIKRELWPPFNRDLYPVSLEYFHELNPYFLCNLYRKEFFKFTDVITVRDGYVTFADFLLKNASNFNELGTKLFIIHPELAPLVPQNIRHYFATWQIVQKNQITLNEASKVVVFGLVCDHYIGSISKLKEKLKTLSQIKKDAKIEVYLPVRRNMFERTDKESILIHEVMKILTTAFSGRDFYILNTEDMFESSNMKNNYFFDLAPDKFITSDNYLHYYAQSRGGTVNNSSLKVAPKDSLFNLDLSLHHELHVTPLPQGRNVFMDILLYKKQNAYVKDFTYDPNFHSLLRNLLS
jgi:hypothetical protein